MHQADAAKFASRSSKGQIMQKAVIVDGVVTNVVLVDSDRIPEHLSDCPEAPDGVGVGWSYDGTHFSPPVVAVDPSAVKAEASRRILEIAPEWQQRNLLAQATILSEKGRENWTAAETASWTAGEQIWTEIASIRSKSNDIEAMDPIPVDFADDQYWQ